MDAARRYYGRFVEFWRDGDLDRERVEEVVEKISEKSSPSPETPGICLIPLPSGKIQESHRHTIDKA